MSSMTSGTKNKAEERLGGTNAVQGAGHGGNTGHGGMGNNSGGDKSADAGPMTQTARDAASAVTDSAQRAASYVGNKAGEAASFVGQKAEDAACAMGGSLKSLGQTIREHTPQGGTIGQATSAVASGLENTGRYLEQEGFQGLGTDMTNLIRRNPIPSIFVALGVGFLVARAISPRS